MPMNDVVSKMPHPLHFNLVLGELSSLISCMRRNGKWKSPDTTSQLHVHISPSSLILALDKLRLQLSSHEDISNTTVVKPFVEVVLSSETSGCVTKQALQAIHRFLSIGLFDGDDTDNTECIRLILQACVKCKFEATDKSKDQVTLHHILLLQVALIESPSSRHLTVEDIWQLLKTCYRIYRQMQPSLYGEVLCDTARNSLIAIIQTIFSRLPGCFTHIDSDPLKLQHRYVEAAVQSMLFVSTLAETCYDNTISHLGTYSVAQGYLVKESTAPSSISNPSIGNSTNNFNTSCSTSPRSVNHVGSDFSSPISSHTNYMQLIQQMLQDPDLGICSHLSSFQHSDGSTSSTISSTSNAGSSTTYSFFPTSTLFSISAFTFYQRVNLCLQLFSTILESAGEALSHHPVLLRLCQDVLMKFLLRSCRFPYSSFLTMSLRCFHFLFINLRSHLHFQIEYFFQYVILRFLNHRDACESTNPSSNPENNSSVSSNNASSNHDNHMSTNIEWLLIDECDVDIISMNECQQCVIDALCDLCVSPEFFLELFLNYDCHMENTNIFQQLMSSICRILLHVPAEPSISQQGKYSTHDEISSIQQIEKMHLQSLSHHNSSMKSYNHFRLLRCLYLAIYTMHNRTVSTNAHDSLLSVPIADSTSTNHNALSHLIPSFINCLHQNYDMKRKLQSCIEKFNNKPSKGISAFQQEFSIFLSFTSLHKSLTKKCQLQDLNEIERRDINLMGYMLRYIPGFDKAIIGQYINEYGPLANLIRQAFCQNFCFSGLSVDDALRLYLESFRLPLEAQQIDRAMQSFAHCYFRDNPYPQSCLLSVDAIHTLSFSILMLNTDQHNKLVKKKMNKQEFISNNRGINDGSNIPAPMLEQLYDTIRNKEIKMSGGSQSGELNDALWLDLMTKSLFPTTSHPTHSIYITWQQLTEVRLFPSDESSSPFQSHITNWISSFASPICIALGQSSHTSSNFHAPNCCLAHVFASVLDRLVVQQHYSDICQSLLASMDTFPATASSCKPSEGSHQNKTEDKSSHQDSSYHLANELDPIFMINCMYQWMVDLCISCDRVIAVDQILLSLQRFVDPCILGLPKLHKQVENAIASLDQLLQSEQRQEHRQFQFTQLYRQMRQTEDESLVKQLVLLSQNTKSRVVYQLILSIISKHCSSLFGSCGNDLSSPDISPHLTEGNTGSSSDSSPLSSNTECASMPNLSVGRTWQKWFDMIYHLYSLRLLPQDMLVAEEFISFPDMHIGLSQYLIHQGSYKYFYRFHEMLHTHGEHVQFPPKHQSQLAKEAEDYRVLYASLVQDQLSGNDHKQQQRHSTGLFSGLLSLFSPSITPSSNNSVNLSEAKTENFANSDNTFLNNPPTSSWLSTSHHGLDHIHNQLVQWVLSCNIQPFLSTIESSALASFVHGMFPSYDSLPNFELPFAGYVFIIIIFHLAFYLSMLIPCDNSALIGILRDEWRLVSSFTSIHQRTLVDPKPPAVEDHPKSPSSSSCKLFLGFFGSCQSNSDLISNNSYIEPSSTQHNRQDHHYSSCTIPMIDIEAKVSDLSYSLSQGCLMAYSRCPHHPHPVDFSSQSPASFMLSFHFRFLFSLHLLLRVLLTNSCKFLRSRVLLSSYSLYSTEEQYVEVQQEADMEFNDEDIILAKLWRDVQNLLFDMIFSNNFDHEARRSPGSEVYNLLHYPLPIQEALVVSWLKLHFVMMSTNLPLHVSRSRPDATSEEDVANIHDNSNLSHIIMTSQSQFTTTSSMLTLMLRVFNLLSISSPSPTASNLEIISSIQPSFAQSSMCLQIGAALHLLVKHQLAYIPSSDPSQHTGISWIIHHQHMLLPLLNHLSQSNLTFSYAFATFHNIMQHICHWYEPNCGHVVASSSSVDLICWIEMLRSFCSSSFASSFSLSACLGLTKIMYSSLSLLLDYSATTPSATVLSPSSKYQQLLSLLLASPQIRHFVHSQSNSPPTTACCRASLLVVWKTLYKQLLSCVSSILLRCCHPISTPNHTDLSSASPKTPTTYANTMSLSQDSIDLVKTWLQLSPILSHLSAPHSSSTLNPVVSDGILTLSAKLSDALINESVTGTSSQLIHQQSALLVRMLYPQLVFEDFFLPLLQKLIQVNDSIDSQFSEEFVDNVRGSLLLMMSEFFDNHVRFLITRPKQLYMLWLSILKVIHQYLVYCHTNIGSLSSSKDLSRKLDNMQENFICENNCENNAKHSLARFIEVTTSKMLSVLHNTNAFPVSQSPSTLADSTTLDVWALTWDVIDPFLPHLRRQIFPIADVHTEVAATLIHKTELLSPSSEISSSVPLVSSQSESSSSSKSESSSSQSESPSSEHKSSLSQSESSPQYELPESSSVPPSSHISVDSESLSSSTKLATTSEFVPPVPDIPASLVNHLDYR